MFVDEQVKAMSKLNLVELYQNDLFLETKETLRMKSIDFLPLTCCLTTFLCCCLFQTMILSVGSVRLEKKCRCFFFISLRIRIVFVQIDQSQVNLDSMKSKHESMVYWPNHLSPSMTNDTIDLIKV